MKTPIKEGEYIATWNYPNCLENVRGCVVGHRIIDGVTTEYEVKQSDGTVAKIIANGHKIVSDYVNYSSDLYNYATTSIDNVDAEVKFLISIMGDDYSKVREIAEDCPNRNEPFKVGDEVIVYPISERCHYADYMQFAKILAVEINSDGIPVYKIKTREDEELEVLGDFDNDIRSDYSGYFIGTYEELVRLVLSMIDEAVMEIERIDALIKELYREVMNTELDNRERNMMQWENYYSNPIPKRSKER